MNREDRSRYYHGGLGAPENKRDWDRYTRDGDYGGDHDRRYMNARENDRYTRDLDDYRKHDHELKHTYYDYVQGEHHGLGDIRQGYGYPSFETDHERNADLNRMKRERANQPDLRSRGMHGYSGAGFGGANYSVHGSFGGSPEYGSMSGRGGNVNDIPSSSGYEGGHHSHYYRHNEQQDNYLRHENRPRNTGRFKGHSDDYESRYYRNRDEQNW